MTKKKPTARPYSLKYTAAGTPRRYLLSGIPAGLWISFTARAKREHIAKRQVLLQLVESWTRRPSAPSEPHVVREGGTAEDTAYWRRRNKLRAARR